MSDKMNPSSSSQQDQLKDAFDRVCVKIYVQQNVLSVLVVFVSQFELFELTC